MDKDVLVMFIEIVVTVAAFFVGRYLLPKVKDDIEKYATEFNVLLNYAESFVAYARQFLNDYSGTQKMDSVIDMLKAICDKQGIAVDDETLRAIAQKAYDAMIAGESSSKLVIETNADEANKGLGVIIENTKTEEEYAQIEQ